MVFEILAYVGSCIRKENVLGKTQRGGCAFDIEHYGLWKAARFLSLGVIFEGGLKRTRQRHAHFVQARYELAWTASICICCT